MRPLDNIYGSVSLVDNKNNVLNTYIPYAEDLNRGYTDVRGHFKKTTRIWEFGEQL